MEGRRNYGDRPNRGSGGFGGGFGGGGFGGGRSPPVKVGDELEVQIEAIGEKGDGVAKKDGFVLFVPNVKQGQTVKIRVTRVLRKVGFAEVVGAGSAPAEASSSEDVPAEAEPDYSEANDSEDFGDSSEPAEQTDSGAEQSYDDSSSSEDFGDDENQ